jgi:YbbR domain-containing protein
MPSLFKRIFVQNVGLKVISLLLAIGLWLVVARSPVAEVVLNVPIVFERVPDKLEMQSTNATEAQIRVRGPERLVRHLRSADVSAHVDLSAVVVGSHTFDLAPGNVHVPNTLEVVQINPARVTVMMERSQ